ncbi:hypothetical protein L7F22_058485 [Adiantum nelumboides]|nr:hypothetical protein [Adiantum nelumboides]
MPSAELAVCADCWSKEALGPVKEGEGGHPQVTCEAVLAQAYWAELKLTDQLLHPERLCLAVEFPAKVTLQGKVCASSRRDLPSASQCYQHTSVPHMDTEDVQESADDRLMDTEDVQESADDRLMDFLYKVNALAKFQSIHENFNVRFDIKSFSEGFSTQTSELNDRFSEMTKDQMDGTTVHFNDVCRASNLTRSRVSKKWTTLHSDWQKIIYPCKFHHNMHCHGVEYDIRLLIYYSLLPAPENKVGQRKSPRLR